MTCGGGHGVTCGTCGSHTSIAAACRQCERGAPVAASHQRGALPLTAALPHRLPLTSASTHLLPSPPSPAVPPLPRTFLCEQFSRRCYSRERCSQRCRRYGHQVCLSTAALAVHAVSLAKRYKDKAKDGEGGGPVGGARYTATRFPSTLPTPPRELGDTRVVTRPPSIPHLLTTPSSPWWPWPHFLTLFVILTFSNLAAVGGAAGGVAGGAADGAAGRGAHRSS